MSRLKRTIFMKFVSSDKNRRSEIIANLLIRFNKNANKLAIKTSGKLLNKYLT